MRLISLCGLLYVLFPLAGRAQPLPETISVRLFEQEAPEVVRIEAVGGAVSFRAGPGQVAELREGAQATVRPRGGELHVSLDDLAFFGSDVHVAAVGGGLSLEVVEGAKAVVPRRYAGRLRLRAGARGGLYVVNEVPLEAYVAAVVASEYGFDDLEGSKAMAVLARTFALRRLGEGRELVDHVLAQKYDGLGRLTAVAREAAEATRGQVLVHDGALAEALYFASSGGHTADNETVWNGPPLPYLRGIPDPYDAASPYAHWDAEIPRDRLLRLLSRTYGFTVGGFLLGERGRDGRIAEIDLLRPDRSVARTIRSNAFRLLVNRHFGNQIKSTAFDARRESDRYLFSGTGYGHGVGLSQFGAREMALQGFGYREILAYYFDGVALRGAGPPEPLVRRAGWRDAAPRVRTTTPLLPVGPRRGW